jgi:hypothetical protein
MKKLLTLTCAVLMTLSVSSQNKANRSHFFSRTSQIKEASESIFSNPYINDLLQKQKVSSTGQYKSADAIKQQLNVVYAPDLEKDEYRYDSKGNLVEDIYYEWQDGNHWERDYKYEYAYDANGNNTINTEFMWDFDQWIKDMKYVNGFDGNGNIILEYSMIWNGSEWENIYDRDEYTYDDKGYQTQHINSYWVETQYMNSRKEVSSYNSNGNPALTTNYDWNGTGWVSTRQSEFIYDDNQKLTEILSSEEDVEGWIELEKYKMYYDSNGYISRSEYWVWEENQWMIILTESYTYDSNGNTTLYDAYMQDMNLMKEESVYDEIGNRSEHSFYELNWETGLLEKVFKREYTYDNSFSFEDLILPFASRDEAVDLDLELLFRHKLMTLADYEGDEENWVLVRDFILEWGEQNVTGLGELNSENQLSLYPNPASKQVTFTLEEAVGQFQVEMFDIHGKMVISQVCGNNSPCSIESLEEGTYFYRLKSSGNVYSGKFLVKR